MFPIIQVFVMGFILIYLFIQSIWDIKLKQVPVLYNNIALLLFGVPSICYYLYSALFCHNYIPILYFVGAFFLLFAEYKLHIFGSGDFKAMMVIFFATLFSKTSFPNPNLECFFVTIFFADLFMLIIHFKKLFQKQKENRVAFFPYLFLGYLFSSMFYIL